jgi:hypothetical protein
MAKMTTASYQERVERIVKKYRPRLGINPSYQVNVEIITESRWPKNMSDAAAWIKEGNTHPVYTMNVRKSILVQYDTENNPRQITQLVVHELLHIVFGEVLKDIKRNYNYDQDGKIEEKLVMQMARAIVPAREE